MIETLAATRALAREAHLLDVVSRAPDQRFVWFWSSPQGLIAPRNLAVKPGFQAASARSANAGWPVAVRSTGGDVTPQGSGIVNVTHVYARASGGPVDLAEEYNRICAPICDVLGQGASVGWQPGAFCDGAYNVQFGGLKFAGTAMRFRPARADKTRYAILAHALMLYAPPSAEAIHALNRFLGDMGEPRVIDMAAHTGLPEGVSPNDFSQRLHGAFSGLLSDSLGDLAAV